MNNIKNSIVNYCKEKKDLLIKLIVSIFFFTFVILLTRDNKNEIEESIKNINYNKEENEVIEIEKDTLQSEEYYSKLLDNLSKNNFDLTINIKKDKEDKKIGLSRETLNKEVIYIKDNNNENYYYKNNDLFYKLDNEKLVLSEYVNPLKYEIDLFYNMNDLITFLNSSNRISLNLNEENTSYKYKTKLSELINFYNSIHSTNLIVEEDDICIINVYYYNQIKRINFDLTALYNYLYHTDYKNVEYEYLFSSVGKVELTDIDNMISQ